MCLLKMSRHLQMLFSAMAHLDERPSLEALLISKVKSLIYSLETWRQVSIISKG
jgi:hypothetical protein